jgi:hypothetical protein
LTSKAQIEANRRNALKSTGPSNTSLTRGNALKHGLTAEKLIVLPYENLDEYDTLLERFFEELQPETAVEETLVEQMATSIWRLRRIARAERAEIQHRLAYALLKFAEEESERRSHASQGGYGGPPAKHDEHFPASLEEISESISRENEDARDQWQREHEPIREDDNDALKALKSSFGERQRLYVESQLHPNPDALTLRYETSLEGRFYRALVMLTTIRKNRIGFVSQNE